MRKRLCYILLIAFFFSGSAQETLGELNFIESSKSLKDKIRTEEIKAMLVTDTKIATVRFGFNNIIWDVFDTDMNREFSEMVEDSEREQYQGHVTVGNTIKVYTSLSQEFLFRTVYCYTFDVEKKTYTKEEFFKSGYKKDDRKPREFPEFRSVNFSVSPNKKYIAFAVDDYRADRNSYTIRVFNAEDNSLAYKTYYSKDKEKYYEYGHFIVNDAAEIYLIGKTFFEGTKSLRNGKPNYEYTLHKVTKEKTLHRTIPIQKERIHALQIQDKGNELLLVGTYTLAERRDVNGIYTITLDKTDLTLKTRNAQKIPLQVYKDVHEASEATQLHENNTALEWYWFRETLTDTQGNTYLLMHHFYFVRDVTLRRSHAGYDMPDGRIEDFTLGYNVYNLWRRYYQNLLVFKIDNQGTLLWGRGLESKGESFAPKAFIKDDRLHLFFNSSCSLEPDEEGRVDIKYKIFTKICLYNFVFDADGTKIFHKFPYKEFKSPSYKGNQGYFENGIFVMSTPVTKRRRFIKFY